MHKGVNVLIIAFLLSISASAQSKGADENEQFYGLPSFVFQTYQFPSEETEKTRVDLKLGLVNDALQFVKISENRYRAGYELTVDIVEGEATQVDGQLVNREIFASSYEETNSRQQLNKESLAFLLEPGEYTIHLDIMDLDTRKHLKRTEPLVVTSFNVDTPQITSLIFMENKTKQGNNLEQNLPKVFSYKDHEIFIQYVLAGFSKDDSIAVNYQILNWDKEVSATWQETMLAGRESLVLTRSLTDHIQSTGQLIMKIQATQNGKKAEAEEHFMVKVMPFHQETESKNLPQSPSYKPLKFIMRTGEYKALVEADSSKRMEIIETFWKQRDPSSDTPENELRKEFNERVNFANEHFAVIAKQKPGWETDRGRIMIRFGKPDIVRNQTNKLGEPPLEVWVYNRTDKRFVFRDKKGNGEYILIHEE